jgi:uncharacterized protein YbjT (DUF2867 family)
MERLFEETVLVLGGAGFIGKTLVSNLLATGYRVRVMVRGPAVALASTQNDRLEIIRGDILNETDLEAAFRNVDSVVHLAHVWVRLGMNSGATTSSRRARSENSASLTT